MRTKRFSIMFKKYSIVLSCNHLCYLYTPMLISTTSSSQPYSAPPKQRQHRSYAMVSNGHSRHNHGHARWPEITSDDAFPTPYQIFDQRKGSPYSKKRFYELVKYYHPDRHDHNASNDGLSYATKLERYRLIIAANEILSNPIKRIAYDTYGAGWSGQPEVASDPSKRWGYKGGWDGPNGPSQNATWEDWERWYQRDAKGPQEPTFTSNGVFVGVILIAVAIGGIYQAARAGNNGMAFIEQTDALHRTIHKDLQRRRSETISMYGNRDERIRNFLMQRDPQGCGTTNMEEQSYRKLLPQPKICSSEDIKQRPMDIYSHKKESKDG